MLKKLLKLVFYSKFIQFLLKETFFCEFYNLFLYHKRFMTKRCNPLFRVVPKVNCETGIVYLLAPSYSNIGDIAIFVQTIEFIKANSELPIKAVLYSGQCANFKSLMRLVHQEDTLCLHGGGNLGCLYRAEELLRQKIFKKFKSNKIISFPQTIYFDKSEKYFLKRSGKNYLQAKNLFLFARDIPSRDFAFENLTKNTFICPDIVLSKIPHRMIEYSKNGKALLCLRHDIERTLTPEMEKLIEKKIRSLGFSFEYFDTDDLSGNDIANKEKIVADTLLYFQNFQVVITNRFHGTVFSYITKTPCIAFDNSYGKVSACFKWYENCEYMFFANSIDEIPIAIKKVCDADKTKTQNLQMKFRTLKTAIKTSSLSKIPEAHND